MDFFGVYIFWLVICMQLWLSWYSLRRPGCPSACVTSAASACQMLRIPMCATMPGSCARLAYPFDDSFPVSRSRVFRNVRASVTSNNLSPGAKEPVSHGCC